MIEGLEKKGTVRWSGEHWISYLRRPGEDSNTGMVSLYNMRYTEAGHGFAAFVVIHEDGGDGFKGLCTTNHDVAAFMVEEATRHASHPPYDEKLPVIDATFTQGGHVAHNPSWTISTGEHEIVASWSQIQPVIITAGRWPADPCNYVHSLLHFTDESSIQLDGRVVEGAPYSRDIWRPTIGGDRSSCVFAISESLMTVDSP